MIIIYVKYFCKAGQRDAFLKAIQEKGIDEASRQEAGNRRYAYSYDVADGDCLVLNELWVDETAFKAHLNTEHYKALQGLKEAYVESSQGQRFEGTEIVKK